MDKQISHFQILEEIGSGGMGVVYRANDLRLRRQVALKVLPAGALADPTIRERLVREAQTASALNHPHIVTVFEIHSAGDRDFIAMELLEGRPLDCVIGDEGLPLEQALRYGLQIADGLACAHEHGVIHRDLKPQNVMISPGDEVKILDFGLAKRFIPEGLQTDSSSVQVAMMTLTAPGVKVGTPAYMSPEQIESRGVDARSDVFSFGCLLSEMLTGVSPFHRRNAILIFKAVLTDDPQPIHALKPELPATLDGILRRALHKDPVDRYPSMRELLADLEGVQTECFGNGIFPSPAGAFPAPPEAARPRTWRLALLAALAVAAIATVGWLASRPSPAPALSGHTLLEAAQGAIEVSPDGGRLVIERDGRLWLGGASGRGLEVLESVPPAFFSRWVPRSPALAPDGRSLVYFQPEAGSAGSLWVIPVAGGRPLRLVDESFRGGDPAWAPDGRWIVFAGDFGGGSQLWCVPARGGEPMRLSSGAGRHGSPAFSADGRRFVYSVRHSSSALVHRTPSGEERTVFANGREIVRPDVTPGGDRIAFSAPAGPDEHLFVADLTSGAVRQVTRGSGERNVLPRWSADGADLYFYQQRPVPSLRRVAAAGGGSRQILARWSADRQYGAAMAPGGERVAYVPLAGGVPGGLRVRDLESGGERAYGEVLLDPRWSPDGGQILGWGAAGRVVLCSAAGGDCDFLAEGWQPQWVAGGREVTFVRTAAAADAVVSYEIWALAIESGEARRLAEVEGPGLLDLGYGALADGGVIWNRLLPGREELWQAEVE